MNFIQKLVESYGIAPLAWVVMLFGGAFVIASTASGRFFVESFATFVYGVATIYWWIWGRREEPMPAWVYVIGHIIFFLLWFALFATRHIF